MAMDGDSFRKVTDEKSSFYCHNTQIETAKYLALELTQERLRTNHVVLVAKMQSGKTGICNTLVNIINNTSLKDDMHIEKYLFITGMNDCGLKSQTYQRIIGQINEATIDNIYQGEKRLKKDKKKKYKFAILKNSDLKNYKESLKNTLIFIDESHYGSNQTNRLTKFLEDKGIDWKNKNDLFINNIYIVSISATPFDELVSDLASCKKIIAHKTDDSYIGISEYLAKDMIFQAKKDDVTDGTLSMYLDEAYDRMQENNEIGIAIVRTRKWESLSQDETIQSKYDVFLMTAENNKIEYDVLSQKMEDRIIANHTNNKNCFRGNDEEVVIKPLLVIIKGAFRAGITLKSRHKDIIYLIHDYSVDASATAQALLGRMCGYRDKTSASFNTYFYVNRKYAEMYAEWEANFENRELIPSSQTKWVWADNDYHGDGVKLGTKSCGNFTIENLTEEELHYIWKSCKGNRNRMKVMESVIQEIFSKRGIDIPYDYLMETYMSGKDNYAKSCQTKRFDSFTESSIVCQFRPEKCQKFQDDNNGRDYLTCEDVGKRAISIVFDTNIIVNGKSVTFNGNRRLLIYYFEVGQKREVINRDKQYKEHKDTNIINLLESN